MTSFFSCQPVLLESEWVLRSVYKLRRTDIARALYTVLGHDNAVVWSVAAVANALRAYEAGADLADALHTELAVEAGATRFATFDKQIKSDAVENELLLAATT